MLNSEDLIKKLVEAGLEEKQALLIIDLATQPPAKASEIGQSVFRILQKIWNEHKKLPSPKQKGRVMQIK